MKWQSAPGHFEVNKLGEMGSRESHAEITKGTECHTKDISRSLHVMLVLIVRSANSRIE